MSYFDLPPGVRPASETLAGIERMATQAEANAGTNDSTFLTPLKHALIPEMRLIFEPFINGLGLSWTSPGTDHNNISVAPGACWIPGSGKIVNNPSTITPPSSTTLANNTQYYVYGYESGGVLAIDPLSTIAPAAPYKGNARTKTGDTTRRYLGGVRTNASGVIYAFYSRGDGWIDFLTNTESAPFLVGSSITTTLANVSCAGILPTHVRHVRVWFENNGTSAARIGHGDRSYTLSSTVFNIRILAVSGSTEIVELSSSQTYGTIGGATIAVNQSVIGYFDPR